MERTVKTGGGYHLVQVIGLSVLHSFPGLELFSRHWNWWKGGELTGQQGLLAAVAVGAAKCEQFREWKPNPGCVYKCY